MNKIINNHTIIVLILIISFLTINTYWIINYSPEYNIEDMDRLDYTVSFLKSYSEGTLKLKEIILLIPTEKLISTIFFMAMLISKSEYTPLMVNNLFMIILVFSVYGIGKRMYNKNAGLIATFLIITTPGIIAFSRTIYAATILTALYSLNIYLYLRTNNFKNTKWSIIWSISAISCLLAKYSMIPYIGSIILISSFYIIKNPLFIKKKKLQKIMKSKQIRNIIIVCLIIFISVFSSYSRNADFDFYKKQASEIKDLNKYFEGSRILCDTINYPALLFHTQTGFILFLFFIVTIINILIKIYKKKANRNETTFIIIIAIIYLFYSFIIDIKNFEVTQMLIPLIIILIAGFVIKTNKTIKIILLLIITINGLIYIMPLNIESPKNDINSFIKISSLVTCKNNYVPGTRYSINNHYQIFDKNIILGSKTTLLKYQKQDKPTKDLIKVIMQNNKTKIEVLEITTFQSLKNKTRFLIDYNHQILFYAILENKILNYATCRNFINQANKEHKKILNIKDFDFIILSEISYETIENHICVDFNCYKEQDEAICDTLRKEVKNKTFFKPIKVLKRFNQIDSNVTLFKNINQ